MFLIYIILSLLSLCFLLFFKTFKHFLRKLEFSRNFVGPKTWPLVGNACIFIGLRPEDGVKVVDKILNEYGKTVKIWLGPVLYLLMLDPNDWSAWLCEGLLMSKPGKWFKRRKIITPAFHFKILEQFVETFESNSRVFVNILRNEAEKERGAIQVDHLLHLLTLDIICETAMGVSLNAQTNDATDYTNAIKTIANILHKRLIDPTYRLDIFYQFTKLAREERKALAVIHEYSEKIIIERRKELLKTKELAEQQQSEEEVSQPKMAFLDILLQSEIDGKPLSNLDIREEVDTLMFAGHDTSSSTIHFCLYNLATNPKCQDKCFQEIVQIFGNDTTKPVTYRDLHKLHYLELCIKETLRIFPAVPAIGRTATEDCYINGKFILAGTRIVTSIYHLGRQADVFPEPTTFKPERFQMDYTTEKINPYAYIPFSAGPRNCLGQKFAMLEIKTILTNVLRHFELDYAGNKNEELVLIGALTMSSRDSLLFKFKPRVY